MSAGDRRRGVGSPKKKYANAGRLGENRLAWVRTAAGQFVLYLHDRAAQKTETENRSKEAGDEVVLMVPTPFGASVRLILTALTAEELEKTRQILTLAFALAEPIVEERDKAANDAYATGDDSFVRVYRAVPEFVIRERTLSPHHQRILNRLKSTSFRSERSGDPSGGARGDRPELADGEPQEGSSQDNPEATD